MLKRLIAPLKLRPPDDRAPSVWALAKPAASIRNLVRARSIDHRNGAGHLDPAYEAALRVRVHDRARNTTEPAFVGGTSRANAIAEECGREFVMTVTSGEDGGESGLDEETSEDRGGLFVHTMPR
jgi:hypothetical protein